MKPPSENQTRTRVTEIQDGIVSIKQGDNGETRQIQAQTILWGAGQKASTLGDILAKRADAELDKADRVIVRPDFSLTNYPNIFVIGDLANFSHQNYEPLPGLAAVAMQEGRYVAQLIKRQRQGKTLPPFRYKDKGKMSIIGRNVAVVEIGSWRLSGFVAWLAWVFVHIYYLIGFDNKMLVLFQWAWSYLTSRRGTRLITNEDSFELVGSETEKVEVKPEAFKIPNKIKP